MITNKMSFFAVLVISTFYSSQLFAWGKNGHRIVALVAEQRLHKESKKLVFDLLDGQGMAMVANWADEIRSDTSWDHSHSWHYVSIDDDQKYLSSTKNPAGDVIVAIERFTQELKDKSKSKKERGEALRFLIHFVGDIHQPLHVGRASDRGGNAVQVKWFGKETNLHSVWDEDMIEYEKLSFTEYVAELNLMYQSEKEIKEASAISTLIWADSNLAYRPEVYSQVSDGKAWEYRYIYKHKNYIRRQLYLAGVRLAALLDSALRSSKK